MITFLIVYAVIALMCFVGLIVVNIADSEMTLMDIPILTPMFWSVVFPITAIILFLTWLVESIRKKVL